MYSEGSSFFIYQTMPFPFALQISDTYPMRPQRFLVNPFIQNCYSRFASYTSDVIFFFRINLISLSTSHFLFNVYHNANAWHFNMSVLILMIEKKSGEILPSVVSSMVA